MFNHNASIFVLKEKRQLVLDNVSSYVNSDNKNIRQAAVTLLLNYSIMFLDRADSEGKIQLVSSVSGGIIQRETDAQTYLRLVTMLGNVCYEDAESKELVQSMVGDEISQEKKGLEGLDDKTKSMINEAIKFIMS